MRAAISSLVLALVLFAPAGALAAAPPAREVHDPEPLSASGGPPTAGQIKDAAKGAEARENAASKSIEEMTAKVASPAQPGQTGQPLQPVSGSRSSSVGGRKAIYGDIIIHK